MQDYNNVTLGDTIKNIPKGLRNLGRDMYEAGKDVGISLLKFAGRTVACTLAAPIGIPIYQIWDEDNNISDENSFGESVAVGSFVLGNLAAASAAYHYGGGKALIAYGITSTVTNTTAGLLRLGFSTAAKNKTLDDHIQ